MKTLSELILLVRSNLGEATEGFWSNATIINNINRAKDDLWEAIETVDKGFFLKNYSFITDGINFEYQMPNDFTALHTIRDRNNRYVFNYKNSNTQVFQDIIALTGNKSGGSIAFDIVVKINSTTNKSNYFIKFANLIPNGNEIIIEYISKPVDLVNPNDTLDVLNKWYGYIVDKATYYCLLKGPSGEYGLWLNNSNDKLSKILSSVRKNNFKSEFVEGFLED